MQHHHKPPTQTWRTLLANHAGSFAAIDFFTVSTATTRILFVFIALSQDRRQVVHFNVTEHLNAQWTAQQRVEAYPQGECLDHVIVSNERHLRRILREYFSFYHIYRTHLSLNKDPPEPRIIEPTELGIIAALPRVRGLHHRNSRIVAWWRW